MDHITLKAATTQVTDQGVFEAVISTETADREKDVVDAGAMVAALKKWNRPVPLSWNHSTKAEDIFGAIEPMTARVQDGEVVVQGQVDLDSRVGQEAWRSFKNRTVGFSFGYLAVKQQKRDGGGRHITEVDIFEVTATPTPMNNDTRVLQTKAAEAVGEIAEKAEDAVEEIAEAAEKAVESEKQVEAALTDQHRRVLELVTEDVPEAPPESPSPEQIAEAALKQLLDESEYQGALSGELKAVWSAAYINMLPDSSFLYIEPDGTKDADGKTTPRSKRHFPVKDANGTVDLPHLRNALARIPQSNLLQSIKDRLTKKAQAMLDSAKSVTQATDDIPDDDLSIGKSHMQGPPPNHDEHRRLYDLATAGIVAAPPVKAAEPPEIPPKGKLERHFYDLMLETAIGEETPG